MNYLRLIKELDLKSYNCDFIDIRIETVNSNIIKYINHELTDIIEQYREGAFIRIIKNNTWYYSSIYDLNIDNIHREIKELIKSQSSIKGNIETFWNNIKSDNNVLHIYKKENIKLNKKTELIKLYDDLTKDNKKIKMSSSIYVDNYSNIYYGNSKDNYFSYDFLGHEIRLRYIMVDNNEQFNGSFHKYSDSISELYNLENEIKKEIKETELFINAEHCEKGKYPIVLSPEAAGVFAHESFGHKSEADFMLQDKRMREEWIIGKKIGSEILSIVDYGNIKGVSGYVPFDDEGVKAEKTYLIKNGILKGRLHSLRTAFHLNEKPTGNGRAVSTSFEPIVRMTSTYIEPNKDTFDNLISNIEFGYYIKTIKHGSGLSEFTIAPHKTYKIINGQLRAPVKVNVITGNVFNTLNLIDGVSDTLILKSSLIGGCGKAEQFPLRVSYGGPHIRIKYMNIS